VNQFQTSKLKVQMKPEAQGKKRIALDFIAKERKTLVFIHYELHLTVGF